MRFASKAQQRQTFEMQQQQRFGSASIDQSSSLDAELDFGAGVSEQGDHDNMSFRGESRARSGMSIRSEETGATMHQQVRNAPNVANPLEMLDEFESTLRDAQRFRMRAFAEVEMLKRELDTVIANESELLEEAEIASNERETAFQQLQLALTQTEEARREVNSLEAQSTAVRHCVMSSAQAFDNVNTKVNNELAKMERKVNELHAETSRMTSLLGNTEAAKSLGQVCSQIATYAAMTGNAKKMASRFPEVEDAQQLRTMARAHEMCELMVRGRHDYCDSQRIQLPVTDKDSPMTQCDAERWFYAPRGLPFVGMWQRIADAVHREVATDMGSATGSPVSDGGSMNDDDSGVESEDL
ncbi:MAG: hypothetical protein MHM6MM_000618 [Cercozoa sp. M6MM]